MRLFLTPLDTALDQKRFGDPNPQYFSKSTAVQMGGRTAVQMGGVLQYKWEAYCGVSLSSKLRSQESTAIQMGGVLPYKLEVYCRTIQTSCRGWGFRNIAHSTAPSRQPSQFTVCASRFARLSGLLECPFKALRLSTMWSMASTGTGKK